MTILLRMLIHQLLDGSRGTRAAILLIPTTLALTACDDGEKVSGADAHPRCAHDVLEPDLVSDGLVGPAVDPSTGQLTLESGVQYVVSSTYGVPVPGTDGAPISERYQQIFGAVDAQLQKQPGLLALQLGQSDSCRSGRTLAIWKSEEEMYDFVTSQAHLDAMSAAPEILQPGYAVTHWQASERERMTFEEGARQLAKAQARR